VKLRNSRSAALLFRARREAGLTQQALAKLAHISQSDVSQYESGKHAPSMQTLERLIRAAGFDLVISIRPHGPLLPESSISGVPTSDHKPGDSCAPKTEVVPL
jgi:transcriptional regulator with XRE-family HTH domain